MGDYSTNPVFGDLGQVADDHFLTVIQHVQDTELYESLAHLRVADCADAFRVAVDATLGHGFRSRVEGLVWVWGLAFAPVSVDPKVKTTPPAPAAGGGAVARELYDRMMAPDVLVADVSARLDMVRARVKDYVGSGPDDDDWRAYLLFAVDCAGLALVRYRFGEYVVAAWEARAENDATVDAAAGGNADGVSRS